MMPGQRGRGPGGPRPEWGGKGPGARPQSAAERLAFEKLPEAERTRVREALEKAWGNTEVQQARERMIRANEELRATIRKVLMEIDPHVADVLAKIRPPNRPGERSPFRPLDPKSPDFIKRVTERLGMELQAFSRPENRDDTRVFHERLLKHPAVQRAIQTLEQMPVEKRMEALSKLREVYRMTGAAELKKVRERAAAKESDKGDTPPKPQKKAD
jgi:hypothetical protein